MTGKRAKPSKREKRHPHKGLKQVSKQRVSAQRTANLLRNCVYEGDPRHKSAPGDFDLRPRTDPRPDKNLCNPSPASVTNRAQAQELLSDGIGQQLLSPDTNKGGYPSRIWCVRQSDQMVFEARVSGAESNRYHGFPLYEDDAQREKVLEIWQKDQARCL